MLASGCSQVSSASPLREHPNDRRRRRGLSQTGGRTRQVVGCVNCVLGIASSSGIRRSDCAAPIAALSSCSCSPRLHGRQHRPFSDSAPRDQTPTCDRTRLSGSSGVPFILHVQSCARSPSNAKTGTPCELVEAGVGCDVSKPVLQPWPYACSQLSATFDGLAQSMPRPGSTTRQWSTHLSRPSLGDGGCHCVGTPVHRREQCTDWA